MPISMSAPTIIVNVIKGSVKPIPLLSGKRWKLPGEKYLPTKEPFVTPAFQNAAEEPPLFGGEVCILSASCVMDSVNIDLYIDAEEDTEAYCISAGVFRRLMQQNVHVRCYAYQMTAERFSDSMWTMQQVLFMSADRRLAIFLTDELAKTGGDEVRMTHDQMAKYMGSAREVVSRMLKYFAQEGWVRLFRGGVQVLDRKKLQQLARGE